MPELKQLRLETPSSSGESEKLKETSQRKKKKFIKHGLANSQSQIPRSSSINRIETVEPSSGDKFKEPKSLVPYRMRKSLSQMDMKQSKKTYARYSRSGFQNTHHSNIVLPKPVPVHNSQSTSEEGFYPTKDNVFYMVNEPDNGGVSEKAAGMKVFATIMLNAWRRRRDDVRRLSEEVDQLQKRSIKVKNQIHVLNSVFRNEQKQNDKLNRQLRHASEELQRMQSSVENLTTALISAKAEASLCEQQLRAKELENDTLNNVLAETNSQLFKSMTQVRHLQTSLSCEQRNIQQLENQKNELLSELTMMEIKYKKQEEQYVVEIFHKDEELSKSNSEIKMLETLLLGLKEKEFQVRDLKKLEFKNKMEMEALNSEIRLLKMELDKCFTARVKQCWKNYLNLHQNTLLLIHLGAFYLLPALPPPKTFKMPITISLEKVVGMFVD